MDPVFITKEYIDQNIRPFSPTDQLFTATKNEVLALDMNDLDATILSKLKTDNIEDIDADILDALRKITGYFVYSRALRTAQVTVTKYGATVKTAQDSYSAENEKIVSDSTYYKNTAEVLMKQLFVDHPELKMDCSCGSKGNIRDQYLKCVVIGD